LGAVPFDLLDDVHAFNDGAEDDMLAIQPGGLSRADEELGPVGVGASVRHRQDSRSGVLEGEVLVLELFPVDGLSTSSVSIGEISTLAHEVGDDTVENGPLVAVALLPSAQGTEVLRRLGNDVIPKLHNDAAHRLVISRHVEEHLHRHLFSVGDLFRQGRDGCRGEKVALEGRGGGE